MKKKKAKPPIERVKLLPVETVQWRINNQPGRWEALGIPLSRLASERMAIILRDRKCQYPGCLCKLEYFKIEKFGEKAVLKPICHKVIGRGVTDMELTIDHKLARCLGGLDVVDNMWLMCKDHNATKGVLENRIYKILKGVKPGPL